jgi:hypothetical protein
MMYLLWIAFGGQGALPLGSPPETFLKKGFWTSKNFWEFFCLVCYGSVLSLCFDCPCGAPTPLDGNDAGRCPAPAKNLFGKKVLGTPKTFGKNI